MMITKLTTIPLFLINLVTSAANNKEWVVDERITFEVHEVFTNVNDVRDSVTDMIQQLEKPPIGNEKPEIGRKLHKRQLREEEFHTWRIVTEGQPDYVYDYEQFKAEYDRDVDKLKKNKAKLNASDFEITNETNLCGTDRIYAVGPLTMICLLETRYGSSTTADLRAQANGKLRKVLYVWVFFFALIFLYSWGHAGWCSEFCPCDICYPQDEYERIKRYLVLNPPGTLTTRVVRKQNDSAKTVIEKRYYKAVQVEHYLYDSIRNAIYQV